MSSVSVRDHGHARELRVGMVCSSVVAAGTPVTGSYWDLLALPLLLMPCTRPRCLMLGLGAGSGARWIRALRPEAHIVGVELSASVIAVARRELELDALAVEVRIADARDELARDTGSYELIIEDIFIDRGGVACKPAWLPAPGLERAIERLAPGGMLVSNTLREAEATAAVLRRCLGSVLELELLDCDNRVYIGSHAPLDADRLRAAIEREQLLAAIAADLRVRSVDELLDP